MDKHRDHIKKYEDRLKGCDYCGKMYMQPWDFNTHLSNNHVWCEPCQGYAKDQQMYDAHCKAKHKKGPKSTEEESQKKPTPKPQADPDPTPDPSELHVTDDKVTMETDPKDHPFKCKHCARMFKSVPQMNMHINRRH